MLVAASPPPADIPPPHMCGGSNSTSANCQHAIDNNLALLNLLVLYSFDDYAFLPWGGIVDMTGGRIIPSATTNIVITIDRNCDVLPIEYDLF